MLEQLAFVVMTLVILCLSDAVYLFLSLPMARAWSVAWVLVLVLIAIYLHRKRNLSPLDNRYIQWAGLYGVLILLIGLAHAAALLMVPGDMVVNAEGMTAARALKRNFGFLFFYLCFPVFIYIQYCLLRNMGMKTAIRWVAVAIILSCLVSYIQVFIDPNFFHINQGWFHRHKFDGLSYQPNDFALTLFLALPLFFTGALLEGKTWVRFLYLLAIPLIFGSLHYAGSRAALSSAILFLSALPILVAIVQRHWSRKVRWSLATLPFMLLLLLAVGLQVGFINFHGQTGMARLQASMQSFQKGGVDAVYGPSYRERQAIIAQGLIHDAPLGGWGPGGFFREQSNAVYHSTGLVEGARETALNYYLNIASDFGIPLSILQMLLLLLPAWWGIKACRQSSDDRVRLISGILLLANLVFMLVIIVMPPTFMLEPFWLWTLDIVLLLKLTSQHQNGYFWRRSRVASALFVVGLLAIVSIGTWQTAFGSQGYAERQHTSWWDNPYDKSCFPKTFSDDEDVRICAAHSILRVWLPDVVVGETIKGRIKVLNWDADLHPLSLSCKTYHGKGNLMAIQDNAWHNLSFRVNSEDIRRGHLSNRKTKPYILLPMTLSAVENKVESDMVMIGARLMLSLSAK